MFDWVLNTPLVYVLQERFTEFQHLSDMVKVDFKNLSLPSCFSNLKKIMLVWLFHDGDFYHKETSPLIDMQMNGLVTSPMNELTKKM